jgi:hypothetical protein
MPETQDVNAGQSVTDPAVSQVGSDDSVGQVATGTGDGATADGQQGATQDAAGSQDKSVPYERFKAVNDAKNAAEQKALEAQAQLDLVQANQGGQQQQAPQQQDLYNVCINQLGYQDKEWLNVEENGKVLNLMMNYQSQTNASQSFVSSHSDFAEIVGKVVAGTFVPSAQAAAYLAKNQHIQQALRNNPQAGIVLYELIKSSQPSQADTTTQQANQAAQILANANQAAQQSISAVPGGGTLDKVAAMKAMSEEEMAVYRENIKSRAT